MEKHSSAREFYFFSFLIAVRNWSFVADETSELLTDTDTDTTMILVILWYSYD